MAEATKTSAPVSTNGSPAAAPASASTTKVAPGLRFERRFSKAGVSPYDEVKWERRTAAINDMSGKIIFEQKDVEVPVDWSMTATNIVASKYLHGHVGVPQGQEGARETGVRQLVARVAESITTWGLKGGYFASTGRRRHLPRRSRAPAGQPEGRLQLAGMVQRGLRSPGAQLPRRRTGTGIRRPARSPSPPPAIAIRSALPASSTPSMTRSIPS